MRLIDADTIEYVVSEEGCQDDYAFRYDINEMPTIDAVPVVRCRDCVNGELCLNLQGSEYVVCKLDENHVWLPDGFCSYGERRPDDA